TLFAFFCQAEDGIRDRNVTGVQTCALPICQNVEITASLFNVLNFLNKEWGTKKSLNGSYNIYEAVYFQGYENGKPKIKFDPATVSDSQMYSIDDLNSRWQLQIGLRYNF